MEPGKEPGKTSEGKQKLKHLEFKEKFRRQLLSGEKKATVRLHTTLREGDRVLIHCGGEILGEGMVERVEEKRPDELTEEDAKDDGFASLHELLEEIKRLYGDVDRVFVIRFSMKPFSQGKNPQNFYYGQADLKEIAELALKNLQLGEKEKRILQLFLETGSIIRAAKRLGGLRKRGLIREVLRKCYRELIKKEIIDERRENEENEKV